MLTHVILATVRGEGRLRAAGRYVVSAVSAGLPGSAGSADEFQIAHFIGVRGSLERDISSLRASGPGGGQISRVVHVSTRADFGVFAEKHGFVQEGHTFLGKAWFRARGVHSS